MVSAAKKKKKKSSKKGSNELGMKIAVTSSYVPTVPVKRIESEPLKCAAHTLRCMSGIETAPKKEPHKKKRAPVEVTPTGGLMYLIGRFAGMVKRLATFD